MQTLINLIDDFILSSVFTIPTLDLTGSAPDIGIADNTTSSLNMTLPGGGDGINCRVSVPEQGATVKVTVKLFHLTFSLKQIY